MCLQTENDSTEEARLPCSHDGRVEEVNENMMCVSSKRFLV